jgi:hypothetical protein
MNTITVTPTFVMAGVGVLLVLLWVWRAGARRARAAANTARSGARLVSLAGPVLFNTGLITAAQWVVVSRPVSPWLVLAVLGLPALAASHALTRALTVTAVQEPRRRRGGAR